MLSRTLNCTLKNCEVVHFMLCIFYHSKKKTKTFLSILSEELFLSPPYYLQDGALAYFYGCKVTAPPFRHCPTSLRVHEEWGRAPSAGDTDVSHTARVCVRKTSHGEDHTASKQTFGYSCGSLGQLCPTLCDPTDYSTPGFPVLHRLLELAQTHVELMMPSNCPILCHPLLLQPSIFPRIRVFSNVLALGIRWPKYWNFSFSISPSNEYSGSISFRMDWFDLLTLQGTPKRLLQHNLKASVLRCSTFFMVQLSHP